MTDQCVQSTGWSVPRLRARPATLPPVSIPPVANHQAVFRTFACHLARMAEEEIAAAGRKGKMERKR
ncbi:hypothetical protein [Roseibium sediminis]|uniref:hypothetical protein n=1 Tax=Roseibium sediminis TaxID=1775174 RepID=UPI0018644E31|nr:hypothetical protein [Roseibium sediminis]